MSRTLRRVLILLAIVALISGAARQVLEPGKPFAQTDIAFAVVVIGIGFAWFRHDANQRGYKRSALLNTSVIALAIVALPVYLFRSRGFAKGLIATLVFLAIAVAYSLLEWGGEYVAYFAKAA